MGYGNALAGGYGTRRNRAFSASYSGKGEDTAAFEKTVICEVESTISKTRHQTDDDARNRNS